MRNTLYSSIFLSLVATFGVVLNFVVFENTYIGLVLGIFFVLIHSLLLGYTVFYQYEKPVQLTGGLLFLVAMLGSYGTIFYYLRNLSNSSVAQILIVTSFTILTLFLYRFYTHRAFTLLHINALQKVNQLINHSTYTYKNIITYVIIFFYLTIAYLCINLLIHSGFDSAVRSPWNMISPDFFYLYAIATGLVSFITLTNKNTKLSLLLVMLHSFITLSVALFSYTIGYGFDPFIHRATEEVIYSTGQITPKPFYYIGQYSIIVLLAKIFYTSTSVIDHYLLPIFFSIFVPLSIYITFTRGFGWNKKYVTFLSLFSLIIPLSSFIVTTPQGFANTLVIITLLLALIPITHKTFKDQRHTKTIPLWALYLLTAFTSAIHPLAGIPLVIFIVLLTFYVFFEETHGIIEWVRKSVIIELIALFCIAIPLIFVLNSYLSSGGLTSLIREEAITNIGQTIIQNITPKHVYYEHRYNLIKDILYTLTENYYYILSIASFIGFILLFVRKQLKPYILYITTFFVLIINAILLKGFILFETLIEYERLDYANRIIQIAFYFLLPFALYFAYRLIQKTMSMKPVLPKIYILAMATIAICASMYIAYPREDGYVYSKGYNISQADIEAVDYINTLEEDDEDYIVLSNQAVAAASLQQIGFKKYFTVNNEEIFYYPIPTSSPLYNYYLEMVYNGANKNTIENAANFMDVKTVYFVINRYWARSAEIISQAKNDATTWTSLSDGDIYVFKYDF